MLHQSESTEGGEAMTTTISKQHPAVVLRSHYRHLKALLAVAMVAVVGLSVAVAMLAARGDATSSVDPLSLMTPQDARYAQAISALTDAQLAAAFGNGPGAAAYASDAFAGGLANPKAVRSARRDHPLAQATQLRSPLEHGMPSVNPQAQREAGR
jgi:hypothetical protein